MKKILLLTILIITGSQADTFKYKDLFSSVNNAIDKYAAEGSVTAKNLKAYAKIEIENGGLWGNISNISANKVDLTNSELKLWVKIKNSIVKGDIANVTTR